MYIFLKIHIFIQIQKYEDYFTILCVHSPVAVALLRKVIFAILERVLLNKPVNGIIQNESGAIITTVDGSKYEVCTQKKKM